MDKIQRVYKTGTEYQISRSGREVSSRAFRRQIQDRQKRGSNVPSSQKGQETNHDVAIAKDSTTDGLRQIGISADQSS